MTPEEARKIIEDKTFWRRTFSTKEGRDILLALLYDMHYFDGEIRVDDVEAIVLRNYATRIVGRLGSLQPLETAHAMVNSVINLALKEDSNGTGE